MIALFNEPVHFYIQPEAVFQEMIIQTTNTNITSEASLT